MDSLPPILESALEHKLPPKTDYGIAFIGCGGIVNYGHIPSYAAHGFNMVGCYDINPEAASKTVQEHGLKKVYATLDEVLDDPLVQIVDIATMAWDRHTVVAKASATVNGLGFPGRSFSFSNAHPAYLHCGYRRC